MSRSERVIAGRYRLLAPLGEGGMGTVWRARDDVLGREVAVKEVRAPAGLPASEVDRLYARLEREAWAAARIPHRNVVTVYDVATDEGRPWIVMELVRGLSLAEVLDAEGTLPPQRVARIGAEVLAALRAAHDAGVLHRDVKPGNVLIANDGRVVLTDFGIAMVEGTSALTMTGEVVGSPEFLAPERALGNHPGPASDLWSLGVLLYAAVEGSSPFRQDTPLSTLRAVVDEELPPARNAGPLTSVIEGLLRKDPDERMPAADAERDLRLIISGGRPLGGTPLSHQPTVTAGPGPYGSPVPAPLPAPSPQPARPSPDTTTTEPDRRRRTALALIAGFIALALALAGLTYALVNRDSGGGGNGGGSASQDSPAVTGGGDGADRTAGGSGGGSGDGGSRRDSPDDGGEGDDGGRSKGGGGGSGGGGGGANGGTTAPPAQTVKVHVSGAHTEYEGSCPPTAGQAPSFTATFTVGRVPADVQYRWVTASGEPGDPGWKTLSFPSGGGRTRQAHHVEAAYGPGNGTVTNSMSVQVRDPVDVTSNAVAYSVTCVQETPTGGASYSPNAFAQQAVVRPPR